MSDKVKVLDAGGKLMLTGTASSVVEAALGEYLRRGSKVLSPVSRLGSSWTAVCTVPPELKSLDSSQSLHLSDVDQALVQKSSESSAECRVEELGFKRIVYGPSRLIVEIKVEEMKQFGAELIGEIEEENGEWVAVCDTGGVQNTGYRW